MDFFSKRHLIAWSGLGCDAVEHSFFASLGEASPASPTTTAMINDAGKHAVKRKRLRSPLRRMRWCAPLAFERCQAASGISASETEN
jgi:hypothetical protein